MKKTLNTAVLATIAFSIALPLFGQAHARREAALAASNEIHAVQGGTTIAIAGPYDKVFDGLVSYLQKAGYSVDSANKDSGQVATSMEITGGWKQMGKRVVVSVIKDTATSTSLRIAITIQKRYKGLQTEPWGDPTVDDKASATTAQKIQSELQAQLAAS